MFGSAGFCPEKLIAMTNTSIPPKAVQRWLFRPEGWKVRCKPVTIQRQKGANVALEQSWAHAHAVFLYDFGEI